MILAVARELYGPFMKEKVIELNASDERGIDVVRHKIKSFAQSISTRGNDQFKCPVYKLVILDEADAMTEAAQAALRRIIEDYSTITRFCLICNYVSRIIDPLASRCAKFRFKLLPREEIQQQLRLIATKESIQMDDDSLETLMANAKGDLRQAITLLQSASCLFTDRMLGSQQINELTGMLSLDYAKEIVNTCKRAASEHSIDLLQRTVDEMISNAIPSCNALERVCEAILADESILGHVKAAIYVEMIAVDKRMVDGADERIQLLHMLTIITSCLAHTE